MNNYKGNIAITPQMAQINTLITFFQSYPQSYFTLRTLNNTFNVDTHKLLVQLENEGVLIRSKIDINNKPVTHWSLQEHIPSSNRKFNDINRIDFNLFMEPPCNKFSSPQQRYTITTRRNVQENLKDSANEIPTKKPKMSQEITGQPESTFRFIGPNFRDSNQNRIRAPRKLTDVPIVQMMRLSISNDSGSQLNPNSPEFIPKSAPIMTDGENVFKTLIHPTSNNIANLNKGLFTRESLSGNEKKMPNPWKVSSSKESSVPTKIMDHKEEPKFMKPWIEKETLDIKESSEINNLSTEFMTALTKNPVSVLYEFAQMRGMSCEIDLLEIAGPSHKPKISMFVILNGRKFDTIVATNKKEGKRLAADAAIRKLISEGHFAERISRLSTRAAFKDNDINSIEINASKNSVSMLDKMASLIHNQFSKLLKELSPDEGKALAGRKVLSALVMQDVKHDTFQVVSLATGNRCISGDKISLEGKVVNDCHAEIVVRRAFVLFLYHQLFAHISDSEASLGIFEDHHETISTSRRFKLKGHIKFHLYISTAPCGDGALFCNRENVQNKTESEMIVAKEHNPNFENSVQGLLRSKIEGGEGTIPVVTTCNTFTTQTLDGIFRGERLKTMSCSDKIVRWNYLGIQGGLLTRLLEPIYISSISLGNLYHPQHLCRAVCCRLAYKRRLKLLDTEVTVNHPDLGYVHFADLQRETDKSNELSINWCYGLKSEIVDGVTGQLTGINEKLLHCSRISKLSLFNQYCKLLKSLDISQNNDRLTYKEAKSLSNDYESKKLELFEIFHKQEYGSWIRKPSEQNEFRNTL